LVTQMAAYISDQLNNQPDWTRHYKEYHTIRNALNNILFIPYHQSLKFHVAAKKA
jgi:hypothetical protein